MTEEEERPGTGALVLDGVSYPAKQGDAIAIRFHEDGRREVVIIQGAAFGALQRAKLPWWNWRRYWRFGGK